MKLNEKTLAILNNFKTIQANIVFQKGKVLKTMADAKNVMAEAELDVEISDAFGIYDLGEFLGTLNLVDDPTIVVKDEYALIESSSGRSKIKYFFAAPDLLTYPTKNITMPPCEVVFTLDESTLQKLKKAASTLGHENLLITKSDNALELIVCDPSNPTSNVFTMVAACDKMDLENFKFVFNMNNFKLISGDYEVSISSKLISNFKHKTENVQYWIAVEKSSEVG